MCEEAAFSPRLALSDNCFLRRLRLSQHRQCLQVDYVIPRAFTPCIRQRQWLKACLQSKLPPVELHTPCTSTRNPLCRLQRVRSEDNAVALPHHPSVELSRVASSGALSSGVTSASGVAASGVGSASDPDSLDEVDSVTGGPSLVTQLQQLTSVYSSTTWPSSDSVPAAGDAAASFGFDELASGDWLMPSDDASGLSTSAPRSESSYSGDDGAMSSTPPLFDLLGRLAGDGAGGGAVGDGLFVSAFTRDVVVADATAMAAAAIALQPGSTPQQRARAAALAASTQHAAHAAIRGAEAGARATGFAASQLLPFTAAGVGSTALRIASEDDVRHQSTLAVAGLVPGGGSAPHVPHEAVRFNRGFFARQAAADGIDVLALAARVKVLLLSNNSRMLVRATAGSSGTLPVRLMETVSPDLQRLLVHHLRTSATMAHALVPNIKRNIAYDFVFDGLHLTLAGLAAIVLAFEEDEDEAMTPPGVPVLMASTRSVRTAQDGGSSATTPANENIHRKRHQQQDIVEMAGCNVMPLSMLFARYPHLPRLAADVSPADITACRSFLSGLQGGSRRVPPAALSEMFRVHTEAIDTPVIRVVFPPDSHVPMIFQANSAAAKLFGMSTEIMRTALLSAHPDRSRALYWTHPAVLMRRVLASIGSKNHGLSSYQFEGKYLRTISTPRADMPHLGTEPVYSPFYGVETSHMEAYSAGSPMVLTSYFSDVVFSREQQTLSQLEGNTLELDAIEQLVLHGQQYPEVNMAMRKLSTSNTTVALWQALDYSSRKMLLRLMNISYGGDAPATPVLDFYEDGAPDFTSSSDLAECVPGDVDEEDDSSDSDEDGGAVAAIVRSDIFKALLDQWHVSENTGQMFQLGSVQPAQLMWLVGQVTSLGEEERDMLLQYVPAEVAAIMKAFGLVPSAADAEADAADAAAAAVGADTPQSSPPASAAPPAVAPGMPPPMAAGGGMLGMLAGFANLSNASLESKSTARDSAPPRAVQPTRAAPAAHSSSDRGGASAASLQPATAGQRGAADPSIPVDFHSEADFPAHRMAVLAPALRRVVQEGLLGVVQKEVMNHLAQSRTTFLHVVLGKQRLQIKKPPLIVRQALNTEMTSQLAAAGVDVEVKRKAP